MPMSSTSGQSHHQKSGNTLAVNWQCHSFSLTDFPQMLHLLQTIMVKTACSNCGRITHLKADVAVVHQVSNEKYPRRVLGNRPANDVLPAAKDDVIDMIAPKAAGVHGWQRDVHSSCHRLRTPSIASFTGTSTLQTDNIGNRFPNSSTM